MKEQRPCCQCQQWTDDYDVLPARQQALLPELAEQRDKLGALFSPHLTERVWCRVCLQETEQAFIAWYEKKISQDAALVL